MKSLGNNRNNKACAQTPRRYSQRFAKTIALNALDSKGHRSRCTAPKKRWKAKRQLSIAAAEVTPQKSPPEAVLPRRIIQSVEKPKSSSNDTTKKGRKKKYSEDNVKVASLVEPVVLAKLDLEGAFESNSDETKNGIRGNNDSRVKTLRSCKVTTYPAEPIIRTTPFPVRLYHMVQSCSVDFPEACRWSEDGTCIKLSNKNPSFPSILRRYFNRKFNILFYSKYPVYGIAISIPIYKLHMFLIRFFYFYKLCLQILDGFRSRDSSTTMASLLSSTTSCHQASRQFFTQSFIEIFKIPLSWSQIFRTCLEREVGTRRKRRRKQRTKRPFLSKLHSQASGSLFRRKRRRKQRIKRPFSSKHQPQANGSLFLV